MYSSKFNGYGFTAMCAFLEINYGEGHVDRFVLSRITYRRASGCVKRVKYF